MEQSTLAMGMIIRDLRKSKSLTQEALAQAAGVSIQAVSKWETGQSLPDVTLLPAIADFFETTVDALFGRAASPCAPEEQKASSPFPDDSRLRVVQYMGSRMMSAEECTGEKDIRLCVEPLESIEGEVQIEITGSARLSGTVNGSVHAAGDLLANASVNGSASAGRDITCKGSINGNAHAEGNITCGGKLNGANPGSINIDLGNMGAKLGNMLGSMFGNRRTGNASGAHMTAFFSGELPDDDILRVVQLKGRRILSAEESTGSRVIRLAVDHLDGPLSVEVYGSAEIKGDVGGNATAGDGLTCGNVSGNATAGDGLECGNVGGNATAGDGMACGNVGGNITAGDGVNCGSVSGNVKGGDSVHVTGDVGGNVSAGDSVTCGNIKGDVRADTIRCSSVGGRGAEKAHMDESIGCASPDFSSFPKDTLTVVQVLNGRILSAQESRKDRAVSLALDDADDISLRVQGDLNVTGGIEGDVHADGSVNCGDSIEGDVHAGGSVSCAGSIEGSVTAGAEVSCGDVEGCVTAGADVNCGSVEGSVTAGMAVHCGDVSGDVSVQGSGAATVECDNIGGVLTVKGAKVSCGEVSGDASIEGCDAASLTCGDIGGCLSAKCAIVQCGGIWGDAVIEGNAPGSFTCNGDIGGGVYHQ